MALGIKKETVDDVLTVFAAVLIFNTLPQFSLIGGYLQQYPMILFGVAIVIIAFRQRIASAIGE